MNACPVEVVKVGGSLLGRADLIASLTEWLHNRESAAHRVLIVGGGPVVDGLRLLTPMLPLDDNATHWQAIRLMELTGQMVGLGGPWAVRCTWEHVRERVLTPGTTQFLAEKFLREVEPYLPGTSLPTGWQVTSDSIAARIAVCLGARRLILLKSRPATLREVSDWNVAARQELVDAYFPQLVPAIPQVECQILPAARKLKS